MTDTTTAKTAADQEFDATRAVYNALEPLEDDARERVVKHVAGILEINATVKAPDLKPAVEETKPGEEIAQSAAGVSAYNTFAELFDAADPQTGSDKALVAGYWLQVCQGAASFDGQAANKELNHLGHKLANITNAMSALNAQRPSLAIQLAKSGSSQQARKTYKITVAGVEAVKAMING